jgi:hypothetical protein
MNALVGRVVSDRPEAGHRASRLVFRLSGVVFADFDQRQWNEPSLRSKLVGLLDPKSYSSQRSVPVAKGGVSPNLGPQSAAPAAKAILQTERSTNVVSR